MTVEYSTFPLVLPQNKRLRPFSSLLRITLSKWFPYDVRDNLSGGISISAVNSLPEEWDDTDSEEDDTDIEEEEEDE